MQCNVCGTGVRPEQKFCMECGARLHHQQTSDAALAPPALGPGHEYEPTTRTPALPPASSVGHPMFDPVTGQLLAQPPPPPVPADEDATNVLPALGEPVNTFGGGTFAPPDPHAQGPGHWERDSGEQYAVWPDEQLSPPAGSYDDQADAPTRQQYVSQPPYVSEQYDANQYYGATGHVPQAYVPWEGEEEPVAYGPTFRVRPLLLLTIVPAVVAVVGMFAGVVKIEPDQATAAFPTGVWKLNDFGTNLTVAGILLGLTMVLGALAWCGGFRWGAGLAGGAGAGLTGWSFLVLGLAEGPVNAASNASGIVGSTVTRDIGYWCIAAAGLLGIVVLITSLLRAGNDGRAGLDPWVAALGAMATITAVLGPLIPLNDANLDENWSSMAGTDTPDLLFVGRFVQLGLLLLCGVFGFLLVRRYGLGLAIGGTIGVGWMVLTSATEQTDFPIGPAVTNPGSTDGKPYIVTIVGIGLMIFFGLVATAMALIDAD